MCDASCVTTTISSSGSCLSRQPSQDSEDSKCCWICLGGTDLENLESPCRCPSSVHRSCLSRWQLQQAGRAEEKCCRFCSSALPDWKETYAPLPRAVPILTVVHNGVSHQVAVYPGTEGEKEFLDTVRRIYGLPESEGVHLTFGCRVPGSNAEVTLEGVSSFDAAVHLAAISAGERIRRRQQEEQAAAAVAVEAEYCGVPVTHGGRSISEAVRRIFRS